MRKNTTLKGIIYCLNVNKKPEFLNTESFMEFIDVATNELGKLEGGLFFEKKGFILGRGEIVEEKYYFKNSFNKVFYTEKGKYDKSPSEQEILKDMFENLKYYAEGFQVDLDKNSFSISKKY
jgi:hypothetical protein